MLSKDKIILDLREQLFKKDQLVQEFQTATRKNNLMNSVSNETSRKVRCELKRMKQEVSRLSQEKMILETKVKRIEKTLDLEVIEKESVVIQEEVLGSQLSKKYQEVSSLREEIYTLEIKIKTVEGTLEKTEKESLSFQEEVSRLNQEVLRINQKLSFWIYTSASCICNSLDK